jgi:hypothetical protein
MLVAIYDFGFHALKVRNFDPPSLSTSLVALPCDVLGDFLVPMIRLIDHDLLDRFDCRRFRNDAVIMNWFFCHGFGL